MQVQNQIRENSMQVRDYLDDLNKWQDEMKEKDSKITKAAPVVTYSASQKNEEQKQEVEQKPTKKYKRDCNTTTDYYKAWDKFNVVLSPHTFLG